MDRSAGCGRRTLKLTGLLMRATTLLILAAAIPAVRPPMVSAQPRQCTLAYVVDGDTVNCRGGEQIRLVLIDAPDRGPFGELARTALAALLPVGSTLTLELDERVRDGEGRLLAYLFLEDGRMVNEMMIRQGYAFLKPSTVNRRYGQRLREAEDAARKTARGIWAE